MYGSIVALRRIIDPNAPFWFTVKRLCCAVSRSNRNLLIGWSTFMSKVVVSLLTVFTWVIVTEPGLTPVTRPFMTVAIRELLLDHLLLAGVAA